MARANTYAAVLGWFHERGLTHPYYARLRRLVGAIGFLGPILWTELAKCENNEATPGMLPLQTFRTCTSAFLQREVSVLPADWVLIAVGAEAYKGLAYRFPERSVIGVPHPAGSHGHFRALFIDGSLASGPARQAQAIIGAPGQAAWLSAKGGV